MTALDTRRDVVISETEWLLLSGEDGTPKGYRQHYRRGEPACGPCKTAIAAAQRARKVSA